MSDDNFRLDHAAQLLRWGFEDAALTYLEATRTDTHPGQTGEYEVVFQDTVVCSYRDPMAALRALKNVAQVKGADRARLQLRIQEQAWIVTERRKR